MKPKPKDSSDEGVEVTNYRIASLALHAYCPDVSWIELEVLERPHPFFLLLEAHSAPGRVENNLQV